MKKGVLVLFVLCMFLYGLHYSNFVSAIDSNPLSPDNVVKGITGVDPNEISPNNIQSSAEAKWQYLKEEWKKIIFRNSFVSGLDSVLKKLNFLFVFLFKENYDLISFKMWIVIILWFISASIAFDFVRVYGHLKIGWSILASVIISTILAQTYFLTLIYILLVKIVSAFDYWLVRLILWIIIVAILFVIYYFEKSWIQFVKISRKAQKQKEFEKKYDNFMKIFIDKDSGLGI